MLLNLDLTPPLCLTVAVTPYIPALTTVESVCASLSNCLTLFFFLNIINETFYVPTVFSYSLNLIIVTVFTDVGVI